MAIQVGIAPDSWGVWFPAHEKQPPWERCMDEMKLAGYAGIELGPWGYFPNRNPALRDALDARGLQLIAATAGGNFLEPADGLCRTIDEIAALLKDFPEARYIVLLPPMYTDLETGEPVLDRYLSDSQWRTFCGNVQRVAGRAAAHGLTAVFHPHADSHVETEAEIERFLQDTAVPLCLDTGHHVHGGGDPVAFYRKHADRIPFIHVKDCDLAVKARRDEGHWPFIEAVRQGVMVEPGCGSVDFRAFHDALAENGYDGWVIVEQDLFPLVSFDQPLPIAQRSRETLRRAGF